MLPEPLKMSTKLLLSLLFLGPYCWNCFLLWRPFSRQIVYSTLELADIIKHAGPGVDKQCNGGKGIRTDMHSKSLSWLHFWWRFLQRDERNFGDIRVPVSVDAKSSVLSVLALRWTHLSYLRWPDFHCLYSEGGSQMPGIYSPVEQNKHCVRMRPLCRTSGSVCAQPAHCSCCRTA